MKKKVLIIIIALIVIIALIAVILLGIVIWNQASDTVDEANLDSGSSYLGYSTGGAKDVENFRENIEEGYFPITTDITYEGIFYDYYFDTGNSGETSDEMFYPSYSVATSEDPISGEEEYYLSVGLNSNIKESDFERKNLNLVILLDISSSMSSSFSSYYYDDEEEDDEDNSKSKMQLAEESLNILIDQLREEDSLGIVLFNETSQVAMSLSLIGDVDIESIKDYILEIEADGSTNFESGYTTATELFEEYELTNSDEYENRIIAITDAMPNYGATSSSDLLEYVEENADNEIYTTFIGVGVDFDTELVNEISNVRGGNYYSVSSASEFKTRMGEEFEYMVTPLVFDLNLDLESEGYEIEAVYGTDDADAEEGNIMHVNTLFPSSSNSDSEVKGGLVLIKLKKVDNSESSTINLEVTYEDLSGEQYSNTQTIEFNASEGTYYDNTGIRKGIVLTRYVNIIKSWIAYERTEDNTYLVDEFTGILEWEEISTGYSSENERSSVELTVSKKYKSIFNILKEYMSSEIEEIGDETLEQEIEVLEYLINYSS